MCYSVCWPQCLFFYKLGTLYCPFIQKRYACSPVNTYVSALGYSHKLSRFVDLTKVLLLSKCSKDMERSISILTAIYQSHYLFYIAQSRQSTPCLFCFMIKAYLRRCPCLLFPLFREIVKLQPMAIFTLEDKQIVSTDK